MPTPRRPITTPTAAVRPARIPWGWPEVVLLTQFVAPALLLVPGLVAIRTPLRVVSFAVALAAWAWIGLSGRRGPARSMAAGRWATFAAVWLALSLLNPLARSPVAALAGLMLNLAILSPVFWVPAVVKSVARVNRLVVILFLCNAASATVGVLQYYYPDRFNPPEMRANRKYHSILPYTYRTDDGREVVRPCGLTDAPGGAGPAGMYACIVGIALALRPISAWKRIACVILCMVGLAAIFATQVRSSLVVALAGQLALACVLALRRDFRKLTLLGIVGGLVFLAGLGWAMRSGSSALLKRFSTLLEGSSGEVYYQNRGRFLEDTFEVFIWEYPLGAGIGRWGMVDVYFGSGTSELWAEIQPTAWIYDGGIPLLVGYSGAMLMALWMAVRVAIRGRDQLLAYTAMIVAVVAATTSVFCLSYVPFIGTMGLQFWVLVGALHGAVGRLPTVERKPRQPRQPRRPAPAPAYP